MLLDCMSAAARGAVKRFARHGVTRNSAQQRVVQVRHAMTRGLLARQSLHCPHGASVVVTRSS
jgi:hypothetical protein